MWTYRGSKIIHEDKILTIIYWCSNLIVCILPNSIYTLIKGFWNKIMIKLISGICGFLKLNVSQIKSGHKLVDSSYCANPEKTNLVFTEHICGGTSYWWHTMKYYSGSCWEIFKQKYLHSTNMS